MKNICAVDGLLDAIPFPVDFADILVTGHVFCEYPQMEYEEMKRVVKSGGMFIH